MHTQHTHTLTHNTTCIYKHSLTFINAANIRLYSHVVVIALTPFIHTYLSLSGSMETLSNTSKSTPPNVRDSRAADRGGSLAIVSSVRTPIFFRLRFLKSYRYVHGYSSHITNQKF